MVEAGDLADLCDERVRRNHVSALQSSQRVDTGLPPWSQMLGKGITGRGYAQPATSPRGALRLVCEAVDRIGFTWEDVTGMTDGEVYDLMFSVQKASREAYAEFGCKWAHYKL